MYNVNLKLEPISLEESSAKHDNGMLSLSVWLLNVHQTRIYKQVPCFMLILHLKQERNAKLVDEELRQKADDMLID